MRPCCILLLAALPSLCFCQSTTGKAETSGPCSPAISGSHNTFNIRCNINSDQGQKMLDILNKILANQLDFQKVMDKLDEIQQSMNPNVPTVTYSCDGISRSVGPSANAALEIGSPSGDSVVFQQMIALNNDHQYAKLLNLCQEQIALKPEWLTPRLACGLAYFGLGDKTNAAAMLKDFDSKTGPAYQIGACEQMSDFLHARLGQ